MTALAQATDGILWIGTEGGLFSFDGRAFTAFQAQPGESDLPTDPVLGLLAARDGAIWVGFRHEGIARISQGRVRLFTQADGLRLTVVSQIRQSSDGALWALQRQKALIRFGADGAWHEEPTPLGSGGGLVLAIFIDSSDTLWLGQGGRLYRRPLNQTKYFATDAQTDLVFGFAETPDHSLWVNDSITDAPGHPTGRTQRIDPSGKVLATLPYTDNLYGMLYAPDGSLIMMPTSEGILRISAQALTDRALLEKEVRDEAYAQKNGLSSDELRALLFDADGNLRAGGQRGLDRFRKARLVPFNLKYGAGQVYLCGGKAGEVWITSGVLKNQLYKISGITHEVSQPISGILTNSNTCARMLAADPPNVAGAAETIRRTIRDAQRASEVIRRLRAMFAKKAPTMEVIDLNEAAQEVVALSAAEIRRSGAVLQTDFADPLPAVSG